MGKEYGRLAAISAILCGISAPVHAGTATTTFPVSATVLSVCSVSALPLAFGNYDPTASVDLDATTSLDVLCTIGTSFTVGLNQGTSSGATVSTRAMVNGADTLDYSLYQDSGRTTNWGNTPGTDTPSATVAGLSATSMTVYGRVPQGQNVPPGSYLDTITVTVNY
ncbi:MAG: spore coat U domain-containing protein [Thermomicrobiales bacterium]